MIRLYAKVRTIAVATVKLQRNRKLYVLQHWHKWLLCKRSKSSTPKCTLFPLHFSHSSSLLHCSWPRQSIYYVTVLMNSAESPFGQYSFYKCHIFQSVWVSEIAFMHSKTRWHIQLLLLMSVSLKRTLFIFSMIWRRKNPPFLNWKLVSGT